MILWFQTVSCRTIQGVSPIEEVEIYETKIYLFCWG